MHEITVMHTQCTHNAVDDLVLHLYRGGPEDDLARVETCSPRFMYIYTINKLLC